MKEPNQNNNIMFLGLKGYPKPAVFHTSLSKRDLSIGLRSMGAKWDDVRQVNDDELFGLDYHSLWMSPPEEEKILAKAKEADECLELRLVFCADSPSVPSAHQY